MQPEQEGGGEARCGRWEALAAAGLPPSIRSGHSLVAYSGTLFAFGGFDGMAHFATLDACILGPNGSATWSPVAAVPQQQQPRPRTLHAAVVHAGAMWVVSGSTPRGPVRRNPFSSFFASANDDAAAAVSVPISTVARFDFARREWAEYSTEGTVFRPRDGHSCVVYGDRLVVYGGSDDTTLFGDVALFDTAQRGWLGNVHITGPAPPSRRLHTAVVATLHGEPCMVVFGGYNGRTAFNDLHVLKLNTMSWAAPPAASGTPPSPRFGHTAVVRGRHMYVFGGYGSGRGFRRDMFRLDLDGWRWESVAPLGDAVAARRCHAAALVTLQDGSEAMAVFGGATSLPTVSHLNDTVLFRFAEDGAEAAALALPSAETALRSPLAAGGLGTDLLRIMDDPAFADVTLSVADRKLQVRAHRAILAARSPVFDRLFRSGMRDAAAGSEVVIEECSPEAFAAFLRWVYSGAPTEDDAGLATELLALAERYMTPGLKPWCEQALLAAMDEASVVGILAVADRFDCKRLGRAAVAFAARHYNAIAKDPEFAKLPQHVLLCIMEELSKLASSSSSPSP